MYKVIIEPVAKRDIAQASKWYNKRQPGLGKRFTKQVRSKIARLKNGPDIAALRYDDIRTAVLDIFPFIIHYLVYDERKLIVVVAVIHTSRSPDVWTDDNR